MKIGMVLERTFPPDIRVEKEIRALSEAGHELFVLAAARRDGKPERNYPAATLRRIERPAGLRRVVTALRYRQSFVHGAWVGPICQFISDYELEALHVHDLPLARTALAAAQAAGIPLVLDLHENYPALMRIWHDHSHGLVRVLTSGYERWERYEREMVPLADRVIVVAEESLERLADNPGVDRDRIAVVMNSEDPDRLAELEAAAEPPEDFGGHFVVSYIGGGGPHRGVDIAIEAMPHVQEAAPDVLLLVVGLQGEHLEAAQRLVARLALQNSVRLMPWVAANRVPGLIRASDICLVPHRKNPQTESGAPHKLFQYMLMRKPVIVSDCAPLKRIVADAGAGLVFEAGNPRALAEKILVLRANETQRRELGERGHAAAAGAFAWRRDAKRLCALYSSLQKSDD